MSADSLTFTSSASVLGEMLISVAYATNARTGKQMYWRKYRDGAWVRYFVRLPARHAQKKHHRLTRTYAID